VMQHFSVPIYPQRLSPVSEKNMFRSSDQSLVCALRSLQRGLFCVQFSSSLVRSLRITCQAHYRVPTTTSSMSGQNARASAHFKSARPHLHFPSASSIKAPPGWSYSNSFLRGNQQTPVTIPMTQDHRELSLLFLSSSFYRVHYAF
jgi:hypothetical protein